MSPTTDNFCSGTARNSYLSKPRHERDRDDGDFLVARLALAAGCMWEKHGQIHRRIRGQECSRKGDLPTNASTPKLPLQANIDMLYHQTGESKQSEVCPLNARLTCLHTCLILVGSHQP